MKRYHTLRFILGDQLNINHSWFKEKSENTLYIMMEMRQETDYVRHHIQKIAAFFMSMRNFAEGLKGDGHQVYYLQIDDKKNLQNLTENLSWSIKAFDIRKFEYQQPDEYRLAKQLENFCEDLHIDSEKFDSEHFLLGFEDISGHFEKGKSHLMESFYRKMRKKHKILMQDGAPVGGKWNYDKANRKSLPKNHQIPWPLSHGHYVVEVVKQIQNAGIDYFGEINARDFPWPLNRKEALEQLDDFVSQLLPHFGKYQDAMSKDHWSLYHSRLSFALNAKMISPGEVISKVINRWEKDPDHADIAQVEGFIRQIAGWREFMRGIYWANMPDYESHNQLRNQRKLPKWYWTGETKMNCLHHSIRQSLDKAYAHHIQRLMVIGNFALLAGIDPNEVDTWYLGIYIDAIQWVEITNTRGMSQYADYGIVGTKPYISSANYIHKMSDYCDECHYSHSKKTGEKACPFNSLYWNFIERHYDKLKDNRRMQMICSSWNNRNQKDKAELLEQAQKYLDQIDLL